MEITEIQRTRRLALIKELEEGEHKQAKKVLARASGRFCCLGVACEVAIKDGVVLPKVLMKREGVFFYGDNFSGSTFLLPGEVKDYYGFITDDGDPIEYFTKQGERVTTVVQMNDKGISFKAIAKVMRDQWI